MNREKFYRKACDMGLQRGCENYAKLNKKGY